MKKFIILLFLVLTAAFFWNLKKNSMPEPEKKIIIDVSTIIGKNKTDIEKILGKPDNVEMIKPTNTPCQDTACEQANYQSNKFEIVFINDKADWITINQVSEHEINDESIELLALEATQPTFNSPGNVTKWNNIENIKELSIFDDGTGHMAYIYIKTFTE
jgi:hypothetical protein